MRNRVEACPPIVPLSIEDTDVFVICCCIKVIPELSKKNLLPPVPCIRQFRRNRARKFDSLCLMRFAVKMSARTTITGRFGRGQRFAGGPPLWGLIHMAGGCRASIAHHMVLSRGLLACLPAMASGFPQSELTQDREHTGSQVSQVTPSLLFESTH